MHAPVDVAFGHLLMDDTTAGSHPLHVTGSFSAVITDTVAMFDGSGEYIGDGFNTAMWVPRETDYVIFGAITAKIIKQQKWIEIRWTYI